MLPASPARAESSGPRVEIVPGATVNIGLLQRTDPWIGHGVGLRVLAPGLHRGRAWDLGAEWRRFDGAEMDGFTTRVVHDRLDRLRITAGGRVDAGRADQAHGYVRLAGGVDLTDGEVRLAYGEWEPESYETRSDRSFGIVAVAGAGYARPLGPISIAIELDVAAGVHFGEDLSRIHEPGGPFVEAQLLVAVGCALW